MYFHNWSLHWGFQLQKQVLAYQSIFWSSKAIPPIDQGWVFWTLPARPRTWRSPIRWGVSQSTWSGTRSSRTHNWKILNRWFLTIWSWTQWSGPQNREILIIVQLWTRISHTGARATSSGTRRERSEGLLLMIEGPAEMIRCLVIRTCSESWRRLGEWYHPNSLTGWRWSAMKEGIYVVVQFC